jgi:hypothetical protein
VCGEWKVEATKDWRHYSGGEKEERGRGREVMM